MKRLANFLLAMLIVVLMQPSSIFAAPLTGSELKELLINPDYVTSYNSGVCSSDATLSGATIPPDVKQNIDKLLPAYQKAAEQTGVPWQLLAAVHYREANNNPSQDLQAGNPLGGGGSQYADYTGARPSTIEASAVMAAQQLISKAAAGVVKLPINTSNPDSAAIKDALFGYNGRAGVYAQQAADLGFDAKTQPFEGSPYVMNNFDAKHQNMKIITRDFGGLDGIDARLGAFTVYSMLGGASGGATCSTGSTGSIVAKALEYAWHDGRRTFELTPAYAKAISDAQAKGEFVGGLSHPGVDCGGFVTRVMRDSGVAPDYNGYQQGTIMQMKWMRDHPEKYQELTSVGSTADLQPGDIAVNTSHTFLYVGQQPDYQGATAESSLNGYAPTGNPAHGLTTFSWFRVIQ
ncbi:hypothetical protein KC976_02635 [Candidatus Saccharibacteria bacterium]|nr:hypothetical protein [Candidatus Saccharibacteria bacterium]